MMCPRFIDQQLESPTNEVGKPSNAFLLVSICPVDTVQASSMQWLYQRLYEQAIQATKPAPTRELFAIMN